MSANVKMDTRVMVHRAMTLTNVHYFCTIVPNIRVVSMKNHYFGVIAVKVTRNKTDYVSILTSALVSMRLGSK